MIEPSDFRFFLDSGAYSAWSRKASIDIEEYCAFIRANIDHIEVYANLDVIAGEPGRHATKKERNEAAAKSWENYLFMCSEGLSPLPVYHAGEDEEWLERMLAHGCDYIGLGGIVGLDTRGRMRWLDKVFERLTDDAGQPIVRTHGFGMTAIPLVFRYPWYSVDSATWLQVSANGSILLPAMQGGEFVYDRRPMVVSVSADSLSKGKGAHVMSPGMRAILDRWLHQCGKTLAEVKEHYFHRAVCNVTYFKRVSAEKASVPFVKKSRIKRVSIWEP